MPTYLHKQRNGRTKTASVKLPFDGVYTVSLVNTDAYPRARLHHRVPSAKKGKFRTIKTKGPDPVKSVEMPTRVVENEHFISFTIENPPLEGTEFQVAFELNGTQWTTVMFEVVCSDKKKTLPIADVLPLENLDGIAVHAPAPAQPVHAQVLAPQPAAVGAPADEMVFVIDHPPGKKLKLCHVHEGRVWLEQSFTAPGPVDVSDLSSFVDTAMTQTDSSLADATAIAANTQARAPASPLGQDSSC